MKFAIIILLALASFGVQAQSKNPVVATVNGKKIYLQELLKNFQQRSLYVNAQSLTPKGVLNDMINKRLGIAKAKKSGISRSENVQRQIDSLLYHAQISKDLEPKLAKINVTNADIEKYYKAHPEYKTSHILFRTTALPSNIEKEAAFKQALKVYEQIKAEPLKFESLAGQFSQATNAKSGGDMGYQPAVRYAPEYYRAISSKPIGYIAPPVKTQFGYHIIKVTGVRDFSEVNKSVYKKIVYDIKRNEVLNKYFQNLRKGAKITINEKAF